MKCQAILIGRIARPQRTLADAVVERETANRLENKLKMAVGHTTYQAKPMKVYYEIGR